MTGRLVALGAAAALGLLMVSSQSGPADAGSSGGHVGGHVGSHVGGYVGSGASGSRAFTGTPRFSGATPKSMPLSYSGSYAGKYNPGKNNPGKYNPGKDHPDKAHHPRRRVLVGVPLAYGAYDYYDDYGCGWLRRKAVYTNSVYWWRRYEACLAGYGDY